MNINGRAVSVAQIMALVKANQLRPSTTRLSVHHVTTEPQNIPLRKWQKATMHAKARSS